MAERRVRRSTWPIPTTTASGIHAHGHVRRDDGFGRNRQPARHLHAAPSRGSGCQRQCLGRRPLWGYRVEEFTRSSGGYTYSQTIPNPIVPPGDTNTSVFNQVRGISFDASGDVVAMNSVNQRVDVFTSGGTLFNNCGQRGFTSTGDFNWPREDRRRPDHGQLLDRRYEAPERPADPAAHRLTQLLRVQRPRAIRRGRHCAW